MKSYDHPSTFDWTYHTLFVESNWKLWLFFCFGTPKLLACTLKNFKVDSHGQFSMECAKIF